MKNGDTPCLVCSFDAGLLCVFSLLLSFKSYFFLLHTHFFLFHYKTQLVSYVIPLFYHLREISSSVKGIQLIAEFFVTIPQTYKHLPERT